MFLQKFVDKKNGKKWICVVIPAVFGRPRPMLKTVCDIEVDPDEDSGIEADGDMFIGDLKDVSCQYCLDIIDYLRG